MAGYNRGSNSSTASADSRVSALSRISSQSECSLSQRSAAATWTSLLVLRLALGQVQYLRAAEGGEVTLQRLAGASADLKQGGVLRLIPHSVFNRQARLTHARRAVDREGAPRVPLEALVQFSQDVLAALEQAAE